MITAIVTDIEGTTTSLSFVKDVLFPYAREHISNFVSRHADDPNVRAQLEAVCRETGESLSDQQIVVQLLQWIDEDKKVTPLKALQGMIWEAGYKNADFTGHIYADAVSNLKKWHGKGIRLYVFSSGSVQAQKLIYGYSDNFFIWFGCFPNKLCSKSASRRKAFCFYPISRKSWMQQKQPACKQSGWCGRVCPIPRRPTGKWPILTTLLLIRKLMTFSTSNFHSESPSYEEFTKIKVVRLSPSWFSGK